jgi:hypothetical protein
VINSTAESRVPPTAQQLIWSTVISTTHTLSASPVVQAIRQVSCSSLIISKIELCGGGRSQTSFRSELRTG